MGDGGTGDGGMEGWRGLLGAPFLSPGKQRRRRREEETKQCLDSVGCVLMMVMVTCMVVRNDIKVDIYSAYLFYFKPGKPSACWIGAYYRQPIL